MKTNNLIFTILYLSFVLLNIIIASVAIIMITVKGQEMMDIGLILLFLETMIFLALKKENTHTSKKSNTLLNH